MTNKKKCLTEFELKTILARGSATEEETDIMREMFQELFISFRETPNDQRPLSTLKAKN